METNYFGTNYESAVDMALLNGATNLNIILKGPVSADYVVDLYRATDKYLRNKETKYDFGVGLGIKILTEKSLEAKIQ